MQPRIEVLPEKKLVGKRLIMTFSQNRTVELWRSFMPDRNDIRNRVSSDLFSMQIYDQSFDFEQFDPQAPFEKWAAAEVPDFNSVPSGMECFTLAGGLYAVFIHKGSAAKGEETFRYIFGTWMPGSEFLLDNRPHFEILGEKYKNEDPESEEEIWIPVRPKELSKNERKIINL